MKPTFHWRGAVLSAALATLGAVAVPHGAALAQSSAISIPAQPLAQALQALARQTGLELIVRPELVAGRTAPAVVGELTTAQALDSLLRDTGLTYRLDGQAIIVQAAGSAAGPVAQSGQLAAVTVHASADASASGLAAPFAGGQVARGGRVGILGTQDMLDTPFSVSSYTNELIRDQQARSVADVLQNDPTVRMARGFGNFQEVYFIRGFLTASDDIAYNGLYGLLPRQVTSAAMVERVEVLRGASAFLYGAAPSGWGIGGTINIVPKRASAEPLNAFTLGTGSGGPLSASADVSRRFGENQEFGVRVNLARRQGGTALDGERADMSLATVGLDWRNDRLRLSADVGWQDNRLRAIRPNVSLDSVTEVPVAPAAGVNYAQPWTQSDERDLFGTVRGEYDLNDDVTAWAAAGMRQGKEFNSLAGLTITDVSTGAATTYRFDNRRRDDVVTGEVGVRAKVRTGPVGHEFVLAASHFDHKENNAVAMDFLNTLPTNLYDPVSWNRPPFGPDTFYGGDLDDPKRFARTRLTSFTLGDTLSMFDDRLKLILGLRHQRLRNTAYDYQGVAEANPYDDRHTSPAAGIVFRINDSLSLYANYIESLARGETAPFTSDGKPVVNGGERLPSFVSRQKEIGLKYDGGGIGASLALFSTQKPRAYVNEEQVFTQEGQDRHQGVELAVFGEIRRGLRILSGVTFLDAKQRNTGVAATDGKRVIGVPKVQGNLGLEWDVPWVQGLTLSGRMVATGSRYANAANTMRAPGWARYDLGARYLMELSGDKLLTVRLNVENLADRGYWASVGGYPGNGYLVQGAPRTVMLNATLEF
ncbi:MAG: TonB-dependent siderophore receptor [Pigmentiphaga sp.]